MVVAKNTTVVKHCGRVSETPCFPEPFSIALYTLQAFFCDHHVVGAQSIALKPHMVAKVLLRCGSVCSVLLLRGPSNGPHPSLAWRWQSRAHDCALCASISASQIGQQKGPCQRTSNSVKNSQEISRHRWAFGRQAAYGYGEHGFNQGDTERVGGRGSNSFRNSTGFLRTPPLKKPPPSEEAAHLLLPLLKEPSLSS